MMVVPDLYSMADVAAKLGKSVRWLQEYLRQNPHGRKIGQTRVFTDGDLLKLIEALPRDRGTSVLGRMEKRRLTPVTGAHQSRRSISAELKQLLNKPTTGSNGKP